MAILPYHCCDAFVLGVCLFISTVAKALFIPFVGNADNKAGTGSLLSTEKYPNS